MIPWQDMHTCAKSAQHAKLIVFRAKIDCRYFEPSIWIEYFRFLESMQITAIF
jgi:hypothetical protein